MAYRPKRPLLVQMRHLLKSGAVAKPKWYDIACMVPPDEPRMQAGRPKFINMPEDKYVKTFIRKNPEIRMLPLNMKSMEPHFALKFARRQLELVQNGYSEKEAYQLTEVELQGVRNELTKHALSGKVIDRLQKQEETYMPDALRIMKANELLEIERLKQREEQEEEYEELRMAQDELDEARARGEFPDSDEDL